MLNAPFEYRSSSITYSFAMRSAALNNSPASGPLNAGKRRLLLRGRKRRAGERAGLSKAKIIVAAAQLLEKSAARGLNIRALATALGVVPTTIKSHFRGGLPQIVSEIARSALAGRARPYKPRETPEDYLEDLFRRILQRLYGRPMIARLVSIELSRNPVLDPILTERILLCVSEFDPDVGYLPRGLSRVIGRLSDMILTECAQSDDASQETLARLIASSIDRLPPDEFPMLTENAEALTRYARLSASGPPSPTVAQEYAAMTVRLLRAEIEEDRRQRHQSGER